MRTIEEAATIPGWMTIPELRWLRAAAMTIPPGGKFFEVGSWLGRSTTALAVDHIHLTCVDTFQGTPGDAEQAQRPDIYADFTRNMRRFRLKPGVLRMDALMAASGVRDGSVDGVFQDGDHGKLFYEHFWAWYRKLKTDGLYCGHDFLEEYEVPKVLRASALSFWVVPGTSIWAMRK